MSGKTDRVNDAITKARDEWLGEQADYVKYLESAATFNAFLIGVLTHDVDERVMMDAVKFTQENCKLPVM